MEIKPFSEFMSEARDTFADNTGEEYSDMIVRLGGEKSFHDSLDTFISDGVLTLKRFKNSIKDFEEAGLDDKIINAMKAYVKKNKYIVK